MFRGLKSFFIREKKAKPLSFYDVFGYYSSSKYGWYEVRANQAWHYMKSIAPIGRGIRIIANEFSSIEPIARKADTFDIVEPKKSVKLFLDLLTRPNFDKTMKEFMYSLCASYLVTGEIYIMVTGINQPQELFFLNPAFIHVMPGTNGIPVSIKYQDSYRSYFFKTEEKDASFQFVSPNGEKRLYQIVDFNPRYSDEQRGLSRLSPVYYEIEQYIRSSIHNISSLRKGARPSGVLTVDGVLTKEQRDYTRDQVMAFYSGEQNVGNVMVMDGGKEFKQLSMTNKDMDFATLKTQVKQTLYESLEIPASFFDNSASTFNNKITDRMSLYDFAVLPVANRIYEELTYIMHSALPDTRDSILSFNQNDIPALQSRFIEQTKKKADTGVFLINELRNEAGEDSIGPEGDVLYQPNSLVPVGSDPISAVATKRFREILKDRGYSDEQIKSYEGAYRADH